MASSSQTACGSPPPSDQGWKYDVFLSFRGPDTRKGITFELHDRLNSSGIKTFMDAQGLQVGDVISPTLLAAIKQSRFAVVVLSQNYASSAWCLEELKEICSSMEDNRVLPLFYHIDPTDVRYQKERFARDFSKHESSGRHEPEKVKQWKAALNKVANISGWNTNDHKNHKELIDAIVEFLRGKVVPDGVESAEEFEVFEATRKAVDEVMKALTEDEVTAIGVYGMGGVGKTTMVKHVGMHARKSGIFDNVIIGVVSQNCDLKTIQDTLAEQLGFDLNEKTGIGRAAKLKKEIRTREKILIVLDDIWQRMDLSELGIPTYKELQMCRSKVLLTTRVRNVCHAMKCQETVTLNVLSEEDSWTLFVRNAGNSSESITFVDVMKRVVRECCGLPIALITVARALGDKDLAEWKTAAQRLEKSQSANPDHEKDAFVCVKLSYDYLKDEEYKSFFLLCCLFPEDFDISIEDLFRYAIGKGLFRDADTLEEARKKADSVATHLIYSCLLLKGGERTGCVRMHDVVRDTAIQIAESEGGFLVKAGCGLKDWPPRFHDGCSTVSLMHNDIRKLPEKLVSPNLQVLLLNNTSSIEKIPENFFQCLNELRVLDLSYTNISLLPQSFGLLANLRSLHLNSYDNCLNISQETIDISMIGKLERLEILSITYLRLKGFSKAIGGLANLRILDMTGASIDTLVFKEISKLHKLEELYMKGVYEVEGVGEETDAGFDAITNLSNLRVLEVWLPDAECIPKYVRVNPNWVEFNICISTCDPLRPSNQYGHKSISLKIDTISRLPDWFFSTVMNQAAMLAWDGCQKLTDIFVEYERGRLHALKYLVITGLFQYERMNTITWVPKKPVFENLEVLRLYGVDCVKLFLGGLPHASLISLKVLTVGSCYNWGNAILPSRLLQRLPNLESLHCHSMDGIEDLFGTEEFAPKQSKLKSIHVVNLVPLGSICHELVPLAFFRDLQRLSIDGLKLRGSLFNSRVAHCLSQLIYLSLEDCPWLERIVEASHEKTILPKLVEISLIKLPLLYHESATLDIECPSLEHLRLLHCPKFSASLSDFHSRTNPLHRKLHVIETLIVTATMCSS